MESQSTKSDLVAIYHSICGGRAFWYEPPCEGAIKSSRAELLDGTKPDPVAPIICGSCGQHVKPSDLRPTDERKRG